MLKKEGKDDMADIYEQIHHFSCRVVEQQEQVIMGTIQRIAGEEFKEFTIDKHKVVDAFKRTIPVEFSPLVSNSVVMSGYCPTCGGTVDIERTLQREMKGACCSWCGQRLDVQKLFRD